MLESSNQIAINSGFGITRKSYTTKGVPVVKSERYRRIWFLSKAFLLILIFLFIEKQGTLAQSVPEYSSDVMQYFYFVQPNDSAVPGLTKLVRKSSFQILEWKDAEKEQVLSALRHIMAKSGDVIANNAEINKIALLRVSALETGDCSKNTTGLILAHAGPGYILLTDYFFLTNAPDIALLHEIVHCADIGSDISNSEQWIKFAEPTLSKLRLRKQFLSAEAISFYDKAVRARNIWSGFYNVDNLSEALADFMSTVLLSKNFNHQLAAQSSSYQRLIAPNSEQKLYNSLVRLGISRFDSGQYEDALRLFADARKIDSTSCDLLFYMSLSQYMTGKSKIVVLETMKESKSKYDMLGIGSEDPCKYRLLVQYSALLHQERRFSEEKKLLDEILRCRRLDHWALQQRSKCFYEMEQYGRSLEDLYCAKGHSYFFAEPLIDVQSDKAFVSSALREIARTSEDSLECGCLIGQYYEQMALNDVDLGSASKDFEAALAVYRNFIESSSKKLPIAVKCADISLRLSDLDGAEKYFQKSIQSESDPILVEILRTKILEANRQELSAKNLYRDLRVRIDSLADEGADRFPFSYHQLNSVAVRKLDIQFLKGFGLE